MNFTKYYDYIEEKLNLLSLRVNTKGKLNQLELHTHCEYFYQRFCNKLYSWNLRNLNQERQNVEAIDLIDDDNKLIVSVSATNTKQKVESSLKNKIIEDHLGYTFKFIAISKEADELRKQTFENPFKIAFNPLTDIIDCLSILKWVQNLRIDLQKQIYLFIRDELGSEVDIVKLDSNLAAIINILSKENWDTNEMSITTSTFEIERKITFNELSAARYIINEYCIHHARVDKKYREFDTQGVNKSSSVLAKIKTEYIKNIKVKSADEIFFLVIEGIKQHVLNSTNYVSIPIDELELCINILVVDAFIRCKIFKNPEKYKYVNS